MAGASDVLLAVSRAAQERMARVLRGHNVVTVASVDQAIERISQRRFHMLILGVHFDESRMFELLRHARTDARDKRVPVLCVLEVRGGFSDVVVEGLDQSVKALMANGFLILSNFPDDERGNGRLRRIIDALIAIDGDMHQGLD